MSTISLIRTETFQLLRIKVEIESSRHCLQVFDVPPAYQLGQRGIDRFLFRPRLAEAHRFCQVIRINIDRRAHQMRLLPAPFYALSKHTSSAPTLMGVRYAVPPVGADISST